MTLSMRLASIAPRWFDLVAGRVLDLVIHAVERRRDRHRLTRLAR